VNGYSDVAPSVRESEERAARWEQDAREERRRGWVYPAIVFVGVAVLVAAWLVIAAGPPPPSP
jgi:hypothetical protein